VSVLSQKDKAGFQKLIELPFVAWQLAQYIKKLDIGNVISFLYRADYINILSTVFGVNHRKIINIRSTTSRYLNEGLLGKINLFLIRLLFNKANIIVSNSSGVDKDLKSLMNIKTETKVIYNPLDLEMIARKKDICEDSVFDFHKDIKYIISVGRLIPLKRNKDLIKAFYELQKKDENLELLFVGDGKLKEELLSYTKELKIDKKVHFIGNVINPFYYLSKSDLFVLNSEVEGFPNVLVEAMACKVPVISSDCKSGPSEILDGETYGYLYPVGDVDMLVKKMNYVLYENTELDILTENAYKRVEDFEISKIMREFKEII
jgi:N-acetylgalactosamine-N,N'-diacetylbacillosaminyl-diphospho-undecaprenol 4-alpha-N-acetylgalactosaminyltransferase